jgi:predicted ester cyclase
MPDTQAVVQRYLDEFHNGPHQWDRAEEILAPSYRRHGPPFEGGERELAEMKHAMAAFHEAFPDMHTEVLDRMIHDDRAVMVIRITGTQSGRFLDMESGAKISIDGIWIVRVEGDKVAEEWIAYDTATGMQQLGLIPKPAIA